VVANSFGIFTVKSNGSGRGIITGANYQLYFVNSPAHPGDSGTIWGTGIGTSPGDNGAVPPQQIDMPNLPLSVYVGTQAASVSYRGRAAFTGEDQINFVVPAGITGCYVPVTVQIGNIVSNFVTMPIAPAGQSCPDPVPPVASLPVNYTPTGEILLVRNTMIGSTIVGNTTSTTDSASASFGSPQIGAFPYGPPYIGNPYSLQVGTCIGYASFPFVFDIAGYDLNAGPAITITGPNGSQQLTAGAPDAGSYSGLLWGGSGPNATPLYLSAGSYTASGPGGTAVGPFSQNFTIPPPLIWTNQANITAVDPFEDLEVTWTGGDPNGTVQITINTVDIGLICNANAGDQHFTIPSFVLLSVPVSSAAPLAGLRLSATSTTAFTASGISSGTIQSVVTMVEAVTYQ
jgi:hypothetical protein